MNDTFEFKTNAATLYNTGAVKLPAAADKFGQAATELHKTGLNDSQVFGPVGPGGGCNAFMTQWTTLRNTIQDQLLVGTANSLTKAGEALCNLAEEASQVDQEHKDALAETKKHLEDPTVDGANKPPPYVTPPPKHTDPHPEEQYPQGPGY